MAPPKLTLGGKKGKEDAAAVVASKAADAIIAANLDSPEQAVKTASAITDVVFTKMLEKQFEEKAEMRGKKEELSQSAEMLRMKNRALEHDKLSLAKERDEAIERAKTAEAHVKEREAKDKAEGEKFAAAARQIESLKMARRWAKVILVQDGFPVYCETVYKARTYKSILADFARATKQDPDSLALITNHHGDKGELITDPEDHTVEPTASITSSRNSEELYAGADIEYRETKIGITSHVAFTVMRLRNTGALKRKVTEG